MANMFHSIQSLQLSFQNQSTPHMPHIIKVCISTHSQCYRYLNPKFFSRVLPRIQDNAVLHTTAQ